MRTQRFLRFEPAGGREYRKTSSISSGQWACAGWQLALAKHLVFIKQKFELTQGLGANLMKLSKLALVAAIAAGVHGGYASAQQADFGVQQVSHFGGSCDCTEPACGCESGLGCDGGCDSGCGSGCGSLFGDCELGDPWQLFGEHCGWTAGGWTQIGYHTAAQRNFNSRPNEVQLHQAWLYAEKALDTSNGFDIGGRIDYVYGTDGPDTQAFGTGRGWDTGWTNGNDYGHALPQAYFEAGYGDWSVKIGHFFTIIGWEVVGAPDNFFYSHAYTMYNSEPFTHTGALATYQMDDDTTIWGGYVLGWDGGFDDNGDAFLGGISRGVSDDLTLTYATIMGRFGERRFNDIAERGYMHSLVADYSVTDKLQYIIQNDILDSKDGTGARARSSFGINQYLIYTLSDRVAVGSRFEWWNIDPPGFDGLDEGRADIYALTTGINYRPHANLIIRPEVRYDWARGTTSENAANNLGLFESGRDQFTFGMDTIFLF